MMTTTSGSLIDEDEKGAPFRFGAQKFVAELRQHLQPCPCGLIFTDKMTYNFLSTRNESSHLPQIEQEVTGIIKLLTSV